jgi:ABC-type branched-subunit amino acid transport system substrate-binding protein
LRNETLRSEEIAGFRAAETEAAQAAQGGVIDMKEFRRIKRAYRGVLAALVGTGCLAGEAVLAQDCPIRIGSPLPLTGFYAADGLHMQNAMIMAVEDLNAAGGVLGCDVELISFDIQNMTPEDLTAAADQLVVKEQVAAVVAGYAGMGPDVDAFGRHDTVFIHNDATANAAQMVMDNYDQFSNVFMMSWWGEQPWGVEDFVAISSYPYEFRNKNLAILASEFEWDQKIAQGFREAAEAAGWTVVMEETFTWDQSDWGTLLAKLRSRDPGLVFFSAQNTDSDVTFVREFVRNPVDALVDLSVSVWWTGVVESLGQDGNGIVGWITQQEVATPENPSGDKLRKHYKERWGIDPQASWVFAYDVVGIWAAAANHAGTIDSKAVGAEILKTPYTGYGGRFAFAAEHGNSVRPSAEQPNYHGQIQDGKFCPILITTGQNPEENTAAVGPFPGKEACQFQTPAWSQR